MTTYTAPVLSGAVTGTFQGTLNWTAATLGPILLQHFDTNVSDSSGNNIPFTLTTPAFIDTSSKQFGAGSLNCPNANSSGNNDIAYSPIAVGGLLDLANVPNWTIEGWINPVVTANNAQTFLGIGFYSNTGGTNASGILLGNAGGSGELQANLYGASATVNCVNNAAAFTGGVWTHFAIVKTAGGGSAGADLFQLYVNGVGSTSPQNMTGPYTSWGGANGYFVYGGYYNPLSGWVTANQTSEGVSFDEVRVSASALYSANFTPPSAPFSGGGATAPGYDLYRNGSSIYTVLGNVLTYVDNVPSFGTYNYQVFPWDGTSDYANGSNIVPLTFGAAAGGIECRFVSAAVYKAIMVADPGNINPRVWPPAIDPTIKLTLPRVL